MDYCSIKEEGRGMWMVELGAARYFGNIDIIDGSQVGVLSEDNRYRYHAIGINDNTHQA